MIQGSITIRDAGKEDVEIVAWTVLTALDMDTDEMEKFIKSCSKDDSIYSWRNAIIATIGSTNLRQVFDNQEINMKNICSVQIK